MQNNPLYSNDPLLDLLFNDLSWGPGIVFVLSLVLQVLLTLALTYRDNTWKDEDIIVQPGSEHPRNGHGFLTVNNLYFFFLPFLNFAIFKYYEDTFVNTMMLINSGITFDVPTDQVAEIVFQDFNKAITIIAVVIAFLIAGAFYYASVFLPGRIKVDDDKYILRTDWLFKNGKPRPVCYVFSFTVRFLQVFIVLGWVIRHLLLSFFVYNDLFFSAELSTRLVPLHPDGMFGLASLEEVALSTSWVFALIGLVVAAWIVGTGATYGGWRNLRYDPSIPLAILSFSILAPVGVAVILEPGHKLMTKTKIDVLKELGQCISESTLHQGHIEMGTNLDSMAELNAVYHNVAAVPTWPLRFGSTTRVFANMFVPAMIAVLVEYAKSRKKKPKRS
jgi:hypothetical protein